jgi:plasmid stabilization system protein ParE
MGFEIDWTETALDDLAGLVRFVAEDDPDAAVRVGDEVIDHVGILSNFPEIGPVFRSRTSGVIRQTTCRPVRIFYRVHGEAKRIEILHIWHGARRDPEALG